MMQKGQTIPLLAVGIMALAVLAGAVIDLGQYAWLTIMAHDDAATACVDAVEAWASGWNSYATFEWSLQSNGHTVADYSPNEGAGESLLRGYEWQAGPTLRVAIQWREPTIFLSLVGVDDFSIQGQAHCRPSEAGAQPIAVRRSAVEESLGDPTLEYTILGRDPHWDLADIESGTNFRGAVYTHLVCEDGADCEHVACYDPIDPCPPTSPQPYKDLVQDCFEGMNCNIQHPVGTYLPTVSGTSNAQLVKAMDPWVGQKVVVMVFDGEVYEGSTSYEPVRIIGFAVYEVTKVTTNRVEARLDSPLYPSWNDIDISFKPREIPW